MPRSSTVVGNWPLIAAILKQKLWDENRLLRECQWDHYKNLQSIKKRKPVEMDTLLRIATALDKKDGEAKASLLLLEKNATLEDWNQCVTQQKQTAPPDESILITTDRISEYDFQIGDTVQFKSGGSLMTVDSLSDMPQFVHCVWFEGEEKRGWNHHPETLRIVKRASDGAIQVGDLVRLKSGGLVMTVVDVGNPKPELVCCEWFEEGGLRTRNFQGANLCKVAPEQGDSNSMHALHVACIALRENGKTPTDAFEFFKLGGKVIDLLVEVGDNTISGIDSYYEQIKEIKRIGDLLEQNPDDHAKYNPELTQACLKLLFANESMIADIERRLA